METTKKKHVTYTLPIEVIERLQRHSEKTHINKSILIQLAIEKYIREEEKVIDGR